MEKFKLFQKVKTYDVVGQSIFGKVIMIGKNSEYIVLTDDGEYVKLSGLVLLDNEFTPVDLAKVQDANNPTKANVHVCKPWPFQVGEKVMLGSVEVEVALTNHLTFDKNVTNVIGLGPTRNYVAVIKNDLLSKIKPKYSFKDLKLGDKVYYIYRHDKIYFNTYKHIINTSDTMEEASHFWNKTVEITRIKRPNINTNSWEVVLP